MKHKIRKNTSIVLVAVLSFLLPLQVQSAGIPTDTKTATVSDQNNELQEKEKTEINVESETKTGAETETEVISESEASPDTETESISETNVETDITKESDTETDTEVVQVSELDLGDYLDKMTVGEKQLLSVTILPMEASDVKLTYSSSDKKVATINGMGRITALSPGTTTITVKAGKVSQSFELQVVEEEDGTVPVTEIEIGEHETELEVGKTTTISATALPSDATNSTITYTSSNPAIATVSSTGEVKGISKGEVTITIAAGEITKSVQLNVKVATTGINMNKDYLVLKTSETFQLSAKVTPAEANQGVSYRSVDTSVANVSSGGMVTAKECGSTTIIVSNKDTSVAVSVIVNEPVSYQQQKEAKEQNTSEEKVYADTVLASEQQVIDAEMLRYLYERKEVLQIIGEGYIIEIDGNDIVNYKNEFYTDLSLQRENERTTFVLNQGKELCGAVTVYLENAKGKYLYLYNNVKVKYERIQVSNMGELRLTTSGEYRLQETKLMSDMNIVLYSVVIGMVLLLIALAVYIIVKRKYWFW